MFSTVKYKISLWPWQLIWLSSTPRKGTFLGQCAFRKEWSRTMFCVWLDKLTMQMSVKIVAAVLRMDLVFQKSLHFQWTPWSPTMETECNPETWSLCLWSIWPWPGLAKFVLSLGQCFSSPVSVLCTNRNVLSLSSEGTGAVKHRWQRKLKEQREGRTCLSQWSFPGPCLRRLLPSDSSLGDPCALQAPWSGGDGVSDEPTADLVTTSKI